MILWISLVIFLLHRSRGCIVWKQLHVFVCAMAACFEVIRIGSSMERIGPHMQQHCNAICFVDGRVWENTLNSLNSCTVWQQASTYTLLVIYSAIHSPQPVWKITLYTLQRYNCLLVFVIYHWQLMNQTLKM